MEGSFAAGINHGAQNQEGKLDPVIQGEKIKGIHCEGANGCPRRSIEERENRLGGGRGNKAKQRKERQKGVGSENLCKKNGKQGKKHISRKSLLDSEEALKGV